MDGDAVYTIFDRLAALNKRFAPLTLRAPDDAEGWVTFEALAGDFLAGLLPRYAAAHPAQDRQTPAIRWFADTIYAPMIVAFGAYLIGPRLPDLRPARVWARFDAGGELTGLAWTGAPSTPDDDRPGALRRGLTELLTPAVTGVTAHSSFGKAGAWALAADYVAKGFLWAGSVTGDEALGAAAARAVNAPAGPLHRQRDFIVVEHAGRGGYLVDRVACCHKHGLVNGKHCSTCPNRPLEERLERLKKELEAE